MIWKNKKKSIIRYEKAKDMECLAKEITLKLKWNHIDLNNVGFIRSFGSNSRRTIARCHSMGKAMQIAMDRKGYYLIEVLSEKFDKLSNDDKLRVMIHELMHIPKSFGGGFKHHNIVNDENVENFYKEFLKSDKSLSEYGF
jgi:predicted metallopeptidase